jgi:hypothetical protein
MMAHGVAWFQNTKSPFNQVDGSTPIGILEYWKNGLWDTGILS